jgi:ribA/ribD-fused uncharacterized protein
MQEDHKDILFYEGKYYMFSNFSAFNVTYNGRVWMTGEHAYQAAKFEDEEILELIHRAPSAYEAKQVCQRYKSKVKPNWSSVKVSVMEEILRSKVREHPYVQEKLLETGNREIIEDSPTDSFWGRGEDWQGRNELGKAWMKIRAELIAQSH